MSFNTNEMAMSITSSAFEHQQSIPAKYTCEGENINPPLSFSGIPENTKSLALIMDDPDAPHGIWVHWILWNISPQTTDISEDFFPQEAVLGMNSYEQEEYGGPCPPSGVHRYFFKLYALDTDLDLPSTVKKEDVEEAMEGHVIEGVELVGLYEKSQ